MAPDQDKLGSSIGHSFLESMLSALGVELLEQGVPLCLPLPGGSSSLLSLGAFGGRFRAGHCFVVGVGVVLI